MASPLTFLRKPIFGIPARTALIGGAAVGVATVAVLRTRQPHAQLAPASDLTAGDAGVGGLPGPPQPDVAALIAQGASLATQAAGLGLPLAGQGLDVAAGAAAGSQALAAQLAQSQAAAASSLASSLQTSLGLLPSFAPATGIAPQPTSPPAPTPAPTPTPSPVPTRTLVGYQAVTLRGDTFRLYNLSAPSGVLSSRLVTLGNNSGAPVTRTLVSGRLAWQSIASTISGLSWIPGLTTPADAWTVYKRYRWSDGRADEWVNIGQSGS